MFGVGAGTGLGTLIGATAWGTLQQARDDLELAFVLILARAGSGPVPCADVAQYNDLVARQVQLEQRALDELQQVGIYTGLTGPGVIPQVTACQTGEQSIWLRPEQAAQALAGAVSRYRGVKGKQLQARRGASQPLLGDATSPTLTVSGVVLVGWAAQAVNEYVYEGLTGDEVVGQANAVTSYLQSCKLTLSPAQVTATANALDQARTGSASSSSLPWGLTVPVARVLAFAAGLVLAGGAWYIWGRNGSSGSPALTGSCPRRPRRALVME